LAASAAYSASAQISIRLQFRYVYLSVPIGASPIARRVSSNAFVPEASAVIYSAKMPNATWDVIPANTESSGVLFSFRL
jgi:hypothetical protein